LPKANQVWKKITHTSLKVEQQFCPRGCSQLVRKPILTSMSAAAFSPDKQHNKTNKIPARLLIKMLLVIILPHSSSLSFGDGLG